MTMPTPTEWRVWCVLQERGSASYGQLGRRALHYEHGASRVLHAHATNLRRKGYPLGGAVRGWGYALERPGKPKGPGSGKGPRLRLVPETAFAVEVEELHLREGLLYAEIAKRYGMSRNKLHRLRRGWDA